MTKRIKFVFSSGLGNQLFMYALFLYIKCNFPSIILKPTLFPYKYLNPHNGFELHKIVNDEQINYALKELQGLASSAFSGKEPIMHKTIRILKDKVAGYKNITDSLITDIHSLEQIIERHKAMQFVGFFQVPCFIKDILPQLIKRLKPVNFTDENGLLIQRLAGVESCSIHVRRGDYVGNPYFDVVDYKKYYNNAIKYILQKNSDMLFVVFSDDIPWTKANIQLPSNIIICDWNKEANSYLDMLMMSKCTHNILANSTFSYWGGVLNRHDDKCIIAPSVWAKDVSSDKIIQKNWIII